MSLLVSVNKLNKVIGSKILFEDLSFGVFEGEKLGLLGPNGAGKSTLLKLISGNDKYDQGDISIKRGLNIAYVKQEEDFSLEKTIMETATEALSKKIIDPIEVNTRLMTFLSKLGFMTFDDQVKTLSGGWRKRLNIGIALAQEPDLLIMDEPTNHMDWDGLLLLEKLLKNYKKAIIVVSHDRTFLDNVCNKMMEINPLYQNGFLSFEGGYNQFIEKKNEYIKNQLNLQATMSNKARREIDWLRAGVKARTTKSQSRINEAHELIQDLSALKSRNQIAQSKIRIEIDDSQKKSKKLVSFKNFGIKYTDRELLKNFNMTLGPGVCLGLLGKNGTGKTSLLKTIASKSKNFNGELFLADNLKVIYFDQKRDDLPKSKNIKEYLGEGSDYVIFKGNSVHVASYASRFLFSSDRLNLKIEQLSGGEQARLLIAKILLYPADVLILDEPTNDLDINSIEILEECMTSFSGLILLVSHDRYFLSNLCTQFLELKGNGEWNLFADLHQWIDNLDKNNSVGLKKESIVVKPIKSESKIKLSYNEKKALETIEVDIEKAEEELNSVQKELGMPEVFSDPEKMKKCLEKIQNFQKKIEDLYLLWAKSENK